MGNPVVHFEIRAQDPQRQCSFYSELFGWDIGPQSEPMDYRMIDTSNGNGAISGGLTPAFAEAQGLTFYVQVEDLQSALDQAQTLGGAPVLPPSPLPNGGNFAVMSDPEGNQVGLLQF